MFGLINLKAILISKPIFNPFTQSLLGFMSSAITIYTFVYQWQLILIHSNTRVQIGPLK